MKNIIGAHRVRPPTVMLSRRRNIPFGNGFFAALRMTGRANGFFAALRMTSLMQKNEEITDNQVFTNWLLETGHWQLTRSHLFEVQNVSWRPANPTLRLSAYVGLLRFNVFDVVFREWVTAALPANDLKVLKDFNDLKDFTCGQSRHLQNRFFASLNMGQPISGVDSFI